MNSRLRPIDCAEIPNSPRPLEDPVRLKALELFKALSDGTRLDVFRLISAQHEPLCACDIVDRFDVTQPTISHHLKVLRDAGLITVARRGVWAYYAADPSGVELLRTLIDGLAPSRVEAVS